VTSADGDVRAVHDAARQAARDERDRLGVHVSDYVCGRLAEVVLAVAERRPPEAEPAAIDVDATELP
jgi:microcompartment protein CcmL/EutN